MTETVWFTSDTHFGHKNICELAGRPFSSADEMDEALIEKWNERVVPGDRVYFLGDFSFHKADRTLEILGRLNGLIHLVEGNHDKMLRKLADRFVSWQHYKELKVGDQRLVLFHFALRTWHQAHRGAWHLYGHSHGNLADDPEALSMDVGVDPNNYAPISLEEVAAHMATKQFRAVDHHA